MLMVLAEAVVEEGAVDKLAAAMRTVEEETLKEPGCLGYAFSVDVSDPHKVRITERWESMQALEAHFGMPHMAAFGAAMSQAPPKSMQVKVYEIAGEVPLPGR
jgi:quinol monooxygenase YgiN